MSWSGRTGFALGLEKKVSYNSRGFFPLFFVIYLIWWWREHGGEVVGVGTAFADWIHNATPSSSSPIPLSSWIYHLASSGGMQMLCVCTFSFRRNKMLHIRASVLWGRLYSCLVFWKPSSVIEFCVTIWYQRTSCSHNTRNSYSVFISTNTSKSNSKPYYCWTELVLTGLRLIYLDRC